MSNLPIKTVTKPRLLFRPHPVLGWSLTPSYGVKVGFRSNVVQTIGPDGWRYVPGATGAPCPQLAIYGCSFTYGTGLTDAETYAALLQDKMPFAQLRNRGIGGQSTVQNFLQFRRDIKDRKVDAAIFAVFSDHRYRNIAHPNRMRQFLSPEWYQLGVEHVPVLRQGRRGRHTIVYAPIWQPALRRAGFDVFLPDNHMIDIATLTILSEIDSLARLHAIPMRIALLDRQDPDFNTCVKDRFSSTIEISIPLDEAHTFLPADAHPNEAANKIFADHLLDVANELVEQAAGRI